MMVSTHTSPAVGRIHPYEVALRALYHRQHDDFRQALGEMSSTALVDLQMENLLHHCARLANPEGTMVLLSWPREKPPVNCRNIWGETPLHVALRELASENCPKRIQQLEEVIAMLLDSAAAVYLRDARGVTPLQMIPKMANCPISLVRRMCLALRCPKYKLPKILLANDWTIPMGFLMKSTELSLHMMELSPDIMNPRNGMKPNELLHYALVASCHEDVLHVLLVHYGLDPNAYVNGHTPLHTAAMSNVDSSHYAHMQYLLKSGANPNLTNEQSLRPIHYIIEHGSEAVFKLLIAAGSLPPGTELSHGLHMASIKGHVFIMRYMMLNYDINSVCSSGMTPLHYAARSRCADAVYYLLACGASVDAKDFNGWTALHHAVQGQDGVAQGDVVPVIGLLLHFGANLNYVAHDNHTALDIAFNRNNKRAVYQLVRHIALHTKRDIKTIDETLIEKHEGLNELHEKCLQELLYLSVCGIREKANYLQLLYFTRSELVEVASGVKTVNYLSCVPEGGVKFVSSKFLPSAFPIYGNLLISRVHHANLELMTSEETESMENEHKIDILALSTNEFVGFFSAEYLV